VCVWGPSHLDVLIFDVPSMEIRHKWAKYLAEYLNAPWPL